MKVFYKDVQLNPAAATDYTDLLNKPSINGVELLGDKDTEQIKVTWFGTQAEFDALGTYSPTTFYIIDDGVPMGQQQDYLDLANKPMINGQVLTGNKQSSDLNIYNMDEVDNMLASLRSIRVVSALPTAPLANTMYYVGPDSEGIYLVYLFDSMLNRIDLGESVQRLYEPGDAIRIDEGNNKIHVKYDPDTLEINSEGELAVIAAENTTAYMNGHLLDSESTTTNTEIAWYGTKDQYDAITTKNPETIYFIDDGIGGASSVSPSVPVACTMGSGFSKVSDITYAYKISENLYFLEFGVFPTSNISSGQHLIATGVKINNKSPYKNCALSGVSMSNNLNSSTVQLRSDGSLYYNLASGSISATSYIIFTGVVLTN